MFRLFAWSRRNDTAWLRHPSSAYMCTASGSMRTDGLLDKRHPHPQRLSSEVHWRRMRQSGVRQRLRNDTHQSAMYVYWQAGTHRHQRSPLTGHRRRSGAIIWRKLKGMKSLIQMCPYNAWTNLPQTGIFKIFHFGRLKYSTRLKEQAFKRCLNRGSSLTVSLEKPPNPIWSQNQEK